MSMKKYIKPEMESCDIDMTLMLTNSPVEIKVYSGNGAEYGEEKYIDDATEENGGSRH